MPDTPGDSPRNGLRRRLTPRVGFEGMLPEKGSPRFSTRKCAMAKIQKATDSSSLAEVVDRILDKGIVIDAFAKVSLVGIELVSVEARVVIASVETYLKYAEAIGLTATAAQPA